METVICINEKTENVSKVRIHTSTRTYTHARVCVDIDIGTGLTTAADTDFTPTLSRMNTAVQSCQQGVCYLEMGVPFSQPMVSETSVGMFLAAEFCPDVCLPVPPTSAATSGHCISNTPKRR